MIAKLDAPRLAELLLSPLMMTHRPHSPKMMMETRGGGTWAWGLRMGCNSVRQGLMLGPCSSA